METGASWFSNWWALSPLCASFLPPSSEGVGGEWHAVGQEKSKHRQSPSSSLPAAEPEKGPALSAPAGWEVPWELEQKQGFSSP